MFRHTMARIKRRPFFILAMVVFSAVLAAVLCSLNKNIEDEIAAYEEAYRTIPVKVQMTDLVGVETDSLVATTFVMNALRSEFELGKYLKDIELKAVHENASITINGEEIRIGALIGITSIGIDAALAQRADNVVAWFDGYDNNILKTEELVCIVPETMLPISNEQRLDVSLNVIEVHTDKISYYREDDHIYDMKIVGTHSGNSSEVYIPFDTLTKILRRHSTYIVWITAASAVVSDNYLLEEFRASASEWFATPNSTGEETVWENGPSFFQTYPTALKIDDDRLRLADAAMQNSIKINTMCAYIVLGLSAVAGFFVGFLAIRSRKREITLMRSLGNSGLSIFAGCCAEQILCLIIGTVIGGAAFMWQPLEQIGLFMGIYFVGTIISLVIFISRNLLQGQKEDE